MTRHAPYYRIGSLYRIRLNLKMLVILASTSQDFDVLKASFGPCPTQTSNNKTHHHHRIGLPFSAVVHNSITCTPQVKAPNGPGGGGAPSHTSHPMLASSPNLADQSAIQDLRHPPFIIHSSTIHQPFINLFINQSSTAFPKANAHSAHN